MGFHATTRTIGRRRTIGNARVLDTYDHLGQAGARQVWQVVTCSLTYTCIDGKDPSKCKPEAETIHISDMVDIDDRDQIQDHLASRRKNHRICFALRVCAHTIGFDDEKSNYAVQTTAKATQAFADTISNAMRPPIGIFSTAYAYLNKENCCCCPRLQSPVEWVGVSDGEYLSVKGVGHCAK